MHQQLLRSSDVAVNVLLLSDISINPEGHATELSTELRKTKAYIAELESGGNMRICGQKEFRDDVDHRYVEEHSVRNDTFPKKAHCLITDDKDVKADIVKMFGKQSVILFRF